MREIIEGESKKGKKKIGGVMKKFFRSHTYENSGSLHAPQAGYLLFF